MNLTNQADKTKPMKVFSFFNFALGVQSIPTQFLLFAKKFFLPEDRSGVLAQAGEQKISLTGLSSSIDQNLLPTTRYEDYMKLNLFQRISYNWATKLISLGNKRSLGMDDLWQFDHKLFISNASSNFHDYLEKEKLINRSPNISGSLNLNIFSEFWSSPVTRATLKMYRSRFVFSGLIKFFKTMINFLPSIIVSRILTFVQNNKETCVNTTPLGNLGILYAVSLFVILVVETIANNQYLNESIMLGATIRNTLSAAIYQKLWRFSPACRSQYSVRKIIWRHISNALSLFYRM